ncbi:hypothetical protein CANARDRAFT_5839 [[Candida] arabinofermentans NRRL YB-2248]|uniref:F-box domain-containing protein n=1 Tax=[Candida] arabinofermentans NRRL YB-2248 TaxID=983967 RepID=A0A1E4T6D9_9ASCO|nr:hypothetical protein CANARDRAFT_5839 [[Candida] arabinofermentans NRRL YB-2248]
MLDRLPLEIQLKISENLPQTDCYHLLLCSRSLYQTNIQRLYQSIIIDGSRLYYHKELENYDDLRELDGLEVKSSIIKTTYGLKNFVKSVSTSNLLSSYIELLEVGSNLPGIEFDSIKLLEKLMLRLTGLRSLKFEYNSCFININKLIKSIPCQKNLISINCDYLKPDDDVLHEISNLKEITLSHFGFNLNIGKFKKLIKLEINRSHSSSYPLQYISNEINYNSKKDDFKEGDLKLSNLFKSNRSRKLKLNHLKLNSFSLKSSDSKILIDNIDFTNLKSLELLDITELSGLTNNGIHTEFELPNDMNPDEFEEIIIQQMNNSNLQLSPYTRNHQYSESFISTLKPHLTQLNVLALDLYTDFKDDGAELIEHINDLKTLYVNFRWNGSRQQYFNTTFTKMFFNYMKAISIHKNLKNLILDSINESKHELIGFNFKIISKLLLNLNGLKTLKLNSKLNDLIQFMNFINSNLKQLTFLEIRLFEFDFKRSLTEQHFISFEMLKRENHGVEGDDNADKLTQDSLDLDSLNLYGILLEFKLKTNVQYLKIFNIIVDLKELKIKDRGLDEWFSHNLRNYQ